MTTTKSVGQDMNAWRPEYNARVKTTPPRRLVTEKYLLLIDYYQKKTILKPTATFRNYVLTDKGFVGLFSKQQTEPGTRPWTDYRIYTSAT